MIYWGRWLVRLSIIMVVSFLERVLGLPVVMMMLTSLYASRLDKGWRWGLIGVVSLIMIALFMTPFSIAWLIVSLSYLWFKHAQQFLSSKVIRLIVGSFMGAVMVVIFGFGQIYWRQLVYGVVATFMCIVWFKRHQFYLR